MNSVLLKSNLKNQDLVTIPRKEYEFLLSANKKLKKDFIYEDKVSALLKKRLIKGEEDLKKGKTTTWKFK